MAMRLANEFVVEAGIEQTWELLNDLERVAPCLPGAAITGREGERFLGTMTVKVGSIGANLRGTARLVQADEEAHTAVISMSGKDTAGNAATDATMHVRLEPVDTTSTRVFLDTDLEISGRMAQFGRGAIADVSNRLIGQFTHNLGTVIGSSSGPLPSGQSAPSVAASASGAATGLGVVSLVGPLVMRKVLPVVAGIVVGFALGRLIGRRRIE